MNDELKTEPKSDGHLAGAPQPQPPKADATGLYGMGGLAGMSAAVTILLFFFCQSENRFVLTVLIPHFFQFGLWGEGLLLGLGVFSGFRNVERLERRHKLLRVGLLLVMLANVWGQIDMHRRWLGG